MMATTPDGEPVDPVDVLEFIWGYSAMPAHQWRKRFPAWCKRVDQAHERYHRETAGCGRISVENDATVTDADYAVQRWVFLPLMRAALDRVGR